MKEDNLTNGERWELEELAVLVTASDDEVVSSWESNL